jgi:hypothetical protein
MTSAPAPRSAILGAAALAASPMVTRISSVVNSGRRRTISAIGTRNSRPAA